MSVVDGALLVLIALTVIFMLFGLIGAGRLVRLSALFAVLRGGSLLLSAPVAEPVGQPTGIDPAADAIALVVPGAVIAFDGGILLKR